MNNEVLNFELDYNDEIGYYVTSRKLAAAMKKRHSDVLETLDKLLENGNLRSLIIPSFYEVEGQKRKYKEYDLTKDGFILYMFNIQGYIDLKIGYINRFNEMENFIKETHKKIKGIKINKKPDWLINRVRTRLDQAEYLENQIAYLFEKLNEIYSKAEIELETKTKQVTSNFWDFKTPSDYDPAKEKLPVLYEVEIEKENLEEMKRLGINKDDALNDIVENKTLEKTVKILGQQKLTTKE